MFTSILTCSLLVINVHSSLESVFNADTIDVLIQSSIESDLTNTNNDNSTETSYVSNKHSFPMFNTGTGINLMEYLQEKLYENEFEAFEHNKSLIYIAIVEYHKYLELTKHWVNSGKNNKYVYIPSKILDLVWHWHILQTYEYYLMCNKQFNGIFLHHRPYFGKEKQSITYKHRINKYKKTLADYKNYFGYHPPTIIWGNHKHSIASCDEMHACDSHMANCDEMHACDSYMADCQMHQCDSYMADCQMHQCDSYMADCQMHQCDSYMAVNCNEMHKCI